jgi:hypothetical protein
MKRRRFLRDCGALTVGGIVAGCDSSPVASSRSQVIIRDAPRSIKLYPLSPAPLSVPQLKQAFKTILPLNLRAYPLSYTLHTIRPWGRGAQFSDIAFGRPEFRSGWGDYLTTSLLQNDVYRVVSGATGEDLLVPSSYGVQVRCKFDGGFAWQFAAAHNGEYLQVLAELGIAATEQVTAGDGKAYQVRDVIRDDALRATSFGELEWIAVALSRYLDSPSWTNRFSEEMSFDRLIEAILERAEIGDGVCHGCHLPYALSALLQVAEDGLLSASMAARVEMKLADYSHVLLATMDADGVWGPNWCQTASRYPEIMYGKRELDQISVTGHLLEWLSITPPQLRPREDVIRNMATKLLDLLLDNQAACKDWHIHAPYSHAVKALCGISGFWFSTDLTDSVASA